ncbi:MAG: hypothetical protein ABSH04_08490 [Acidimicrobiales bacterium]
MTSSHNVSLSDAEQFFNSLDPNLSWQSGPPVTGTDDGPLSLVIELDGSNSDITGFEVDGAIGESDMASAENADFINPVQQYAPECVPWLTQQIQNAQNQGWFLSSTTSSCGSATANITFSITGEPNADATLDLNW